MKPLYDKFSYIQNFVKGKKVLDVGVVSHEVHFSEKWYRNTFLHGFLCESAQSVTGIDIEEKGVKELQERGYNVIVADAENMGLHDTFDVIVAGELIEHLANPGNFIKGAYKNLREEGLLILTTPNPFNLKRCIYGFLGKQLMINPEHTCWFDVQTLCQLCGRFGFELVEYRYAYHIKPHWDRWLRVMLKLIYRFPHHCNTIIIVFRKPEKSL